MTKKKTKRQGINPSFQILSNPIFENSKLDDAYFVHVNRFLTTESDERLKHTLKSLLSRSAFRSAHNAFTNSLEQIAELPAYIKDIGTDRRLNILLHFIKYSSAQINEFVLIRGRFEAMLIDSEFEGAEQCLEEYEHRFGESIWYLRNKVLLLSCQGKTEQLREYCEKCKARTGQPYIKRLIEYFQLISDTDDAYILLRNLILKNVDEFKTANLQSAASMLCLLFSPDPLAGQHDYNMCFGNLQAYPVIDQYCFLLEIIQHYVAQSACGHDVETGEVLETIDALLENISDPLLTRARDFLSGGATPAISQEGSELLELYELGYYQEAIDYFEKNSSGFSNALAYINIVAKAHAYLGRKPKVRPKNIIDDLVNHLTSLYVVPTPNAHAEDLLISRAIKLKGTSHWLFVQLALYVALPQKYCEKDAKFASAKAIMVNEEATPIIHNLLSGADTVFGVRYHSSSPSGVPVYRSVKIDICHSIRDGASQADIDRLFSIFSGVVPLRKDYIELYSEYCIYAERYTELIKFCAEELASDFGLWNYFPMEVLVEKIEAEYVVSIESVVILFIYNKKVSQQKDMLLNEIFEEYLYSFNVRKPSELLELKSNLNSLEQLFFKSICIPEIMDFLGSFASVIELRAERVLILDILLERRLIDKSMRMLEVEDLVAQQAVESAVSKLNSAKIFVDDSLLKKMHYETASALFGLYRQAEDEEENQLPGTLGGASPDARNRFYLSGSKNSIAIKIYNLYANAFLFDEKCGLDKNLSTEIRHGFFENLIRSKLEDRNLITEADEFGEYASNTFWREKNPFVTQKVWDAIDQELAKFSASVNELIDEAEQWMKITMSQSDHGARFKYGLGLSSYVGFKRKLDSCKDIDEVAEHVMGQLWHTTELRLLEMRERLNVKFREKADSLFDELTAGVTRAKRGAALAELMAAIAQTKSDIKEDISKSAEWFNRASGPELETTSLDLVVGIAVNAFKDVKGKDVNIDLEIPNDYRGVLVEGRAVKPFIIALVNLLDNCFIHSGQRLATSVKIVGDIKNGDVALQIINSVTEEKAEWLLTNKLGEIRLSDKNSAVPLDLLRTEGGSGIAKARAQMNIVKSDAIVDFDVDGLSFRSEIRFGY